MITKLLRKALRESGMMAVLHEADCAGKLSATCSGVLARIASALPVAELGFGPMLVLADACFIR